MDGSVVAAIAIAAAYVGYIVGVLLPGRSGPPRGGEGDDGPADPAGPDDFAIWERELTEVTTADR